MMLLAALAGLVVALLLSGFFSGSETGLYCVNRLRVRIAMRAGDPHAARLARLLEDERGTLSVTLLGTNLMNYLCTILAGHLLAHHIGMTPRATEILTVVLLTPVVFVFGEIVPKNLFRSHADRLMVRGAAPLLLADRVFRLMGAVWLLDKLADAVAHVVLRRVDRADAHGPRRRVALLLREAMVGGEAGDDQSELVDRVLDLPQARLHDIMVPHHRVVTIDAAASPPDFLRVARQTPHARLPVYDRHRRHIVGFVKVDELLGRDDWEHVGDCRRRTAILRPSDTVAYALTAMQRSRQPMAIVVDRSGMMLGLVTLKDLVEEVVGELADW